MFAIIDDLSQYELFQVMAATSIPPLCMSTSWSLEIAGKWQLMRSFPAMFNDQDVTDNTAFLESLVPCIHRAFLDPWSDKHLMLPDKVPTKTDNHASTPQCTTPVHCRRGHWYGNGEECENPSDYQPANRDDVDGQSVFPHVPRSKRDWLACCSFPRQQGDGDPIGAEVACDCQ